MHVLVGICEEVMTQAERLPSVGIPAEALSFSCPDNDLRISVLQEFLLIDQKYSERLELLDEVYPTIVR